MRVRTILRPSTALWLSLLFAGPSAYSAEEFCETVMNRELATIDCGSFSQPRCNKAPFSENSNNSGYDFYFGTKIDDYSKSGLKMTRLPGGRYLLQVWYAKGFHEFSSRALELSANCEVVKTSGRGPWPNPSSDIEMTPQACEEVSDFEQVQDAKARRVSIKKTLDRLKLDWHTINLDRVFELCRLAKINPLKPMTGLPPPPAPSSSGAKQGPADTAPAE